NVEAVVSSTRYRLAPFVAFQRSDAVVRPGIARTLGPAGSFFLAFFFAAVAAATGTAVTADAAAGAAAAGTATWNGSARAAASPSPTARATRGRATRPVPPVRRPPPCVSLHVRRPLRRIRDRPLFDVRPSCPNGPGVARIADRVVTSGASGPPSAPPRAEGRARSCVSLSCPPRH